MEVGRQQNWNLVLLQLSIILFEQPGVCCIICMKYIVLIYGHINWLCTWVGTLLKYLILWCSLILYLYQILYRIAFWALYGGFSLKIREASWIKLSIYSLILGAFWVVKKLHRRILCFQKLLLIWILKRLAHCKHKLLVGECT